MKYLLSLVCCFCLSSGVFALNCSEKVEGQMLYGKDYKLSPPKGREELLNYHPMMWIVDGILFLTGVKKSQEAPLELDYWSEEEFVEQYDRDDYSLRKYMTLEENFKRKNKALLMHECLAQQGASFSQFHQAILRHLSDGISQAEYNEFVREAQRVGLPFESFIKGIRIEQHFPSFNKNNQRLPYLDEKQWAAFIDTCEACSQKELMRDLIIRNPYLITNYIDKKKVKNPNIFTSLRAKRAYEVLKRHFSNRDLVEPKELTEEALFLATSQNEVFAEISQRYLSPVQDSVSNTLSNFFSLGWEARHSYSPMKALYFGGTNHQTEIALALKSELNTPKDNYQRNVFASLIYIYGYFFDVNEALTIYEASNAEKGELLIELKNASIAGFHTLGSYEKSQTTIELNKRAIGIFKINENYEIEKRHWLLEAYEELPEISRAEVRNIFWSLLIKEQVADPSDFFGWMEDLPERQRNKFFQLYGEKY
jgi:hypothetical protein